MESHKEIKVNLFVAKSSCGHFKAKITVTVDDTLARDLLCATCFDTQDQATEAGTKMAFELRDTIVEDLAREYPEAIVVDKIGDPGADYKSRMH